MHDGSSTTATEASSSAPRAPGHISDTARWVAVYRAMETERPDAIFRDPFARRLAGERGEEIVRSMRHGRSSAWPMIVRTAVFDELILQTVTRDGVDLVLNLAAGLDARPYRLPLPHALRWVDVDFPEILAYKTGQLADATPCCRVETVPLDLTDLDARHALFTRLGAEARRVLVVTEGLLAYLTPEQVGALATDLHAQPSFGTWITEIASPRILRMMQRSYGKQLSRSNAPMHFGPAEGGAFFQPFGWRVAESRAMMEEAERLQRMPGFIRFWRLFGRLGTASRRARWREEWRRSSQILRLGRK